MSFVQEVSLRVNNNGTLYLQMSLASSDMFPMCYSTGIRTPKTVHSSLHRVSSRFAISEISGKW